MSGPEIILETPVYNVNLTLLLAVITVSLAAMGTLIKVFAKKTKKEDSPGGSPHCLQQKENLDRIEETTKENINRYESLRKIVNELEKEVGILKNQSDNIVKNMDEVKQTNKEIASRLDELLKQLLDWMTE